MCYSEWSRCCQVGGIIVSYLPATPWITLLAMS